MRSSKVICCLLSIILKKLQFQALQRRLLNAFLKLQAWKKLYLVCFTTTSRYFGIKEKTFWFKGHESFCLVRPSLSLHSYSSDPLSFSTFVFYSFLICFWNLHFFQLLFQHCFICRPSDSTVSENAVFWISGLYATLALARSHPHSTRCHPQLG